MTEFWEKCVIMKTTKNGRKKDSQRVLRCSEHRSTAFPKALGKTLTASLT